MGLAIVLAATLIGHFSARNVLVNGRRQLGYQGNFGETAVSGKSWNLPRDCSTKVVLQICNQGR
jgi:hypothetical protein